MRTRWLPVIGWALFIEFLVVWPSPPDVPQGWGVVGLDKLVHASVFGVLAVLAARALLAGGRSWVIAFVGTAAYGAFTEFEQHFIPSRSMELGDFLADAAGAAVGLVLFVALARTRREFSR